MGASAELFQNRRVYLLAAVSYMGALLFGYDTGVMGSVLALDSFKTDFGLPLGGSGFASEKNADVSSNVVSLLTAGSFFGAIAASVVNEAIGRRKTLFAFAAVFMVGAAVQTAASHDVSYIYGGRVVAGLGIGGLSGVMSVYVSENAPPAIRGRIAGLFQEMLVIGSTVAYWLDYGVAKTIPAGTRQWRIPVAIQLVPGGLMMAGLCFLRESPRWLAGKGRHEMAHDALAHVRCRSRDDPVVLEELAEIRAAIEEEQHATEGLSWKEVMAPTNRYVPNTFLSSSRYAQLLTMRIQEAVRSGLLHHVLAAVFRHQLHRLLRARDLPDHRHLLFRLVALRHGRLRHRQGRRHRHLPPHRD